LRFIRESEKNYVVKEYVMITENEKTDEDRSVIRTLNVLQ